MLFKCLCSFFRWYDSSTSVGHTVERERESSSLSFCLFCSLCILLCFFIPSSLYFSISLSPSQLAPCQSLPLSLPLSVSPSQYLSLSLSLSVSPSLPLPASSWVSETQCPPFLTPSHQSPSPWKGYAPTPTAPALTPAAT